MLLRCVYALPEWALAQRVVDPSGPFARHIADLSGRWQNRIVLYLLLVIRTEGNTTMSIRKSHRCSGSGVTGSALLGLPKT